MKFTHKLIALVATGIVLSGAALAQNPSRLQLQDADGDRGILSVGTLTATRTFTFPDESGSLIVGAAGSKTLAAGTSNNNTARWNSATSSWDETSMLTVGTDGAIQLLAGTDGTIVLSALGASGADSVGGHLRIRQTTGDANNSDVYLRALGTGDAIAELRLGYNGDDGDFRLYSKNVATEELELKTAGGLLTMGAASHFFQIESTVGSQFAKVKSSNIILDGAVTATDGTVTMGTAEVTTSLTTNAVLYDIALTGGTSPYAVSSTDHVIIIEAGITEVDLPVGALGRALIIKNQSGGAVDIDPNGTETINGGAAGAVMALADGAATHIVYSGGNWYVVGP